MFYSYISGMFEKCDDNVKDEQNCVHLEQPADLCTFCCLQWILYYLLEVSEWIPILFPYFKCIALWMLARTMFNINNNIYNG